MNSLLGYLVSFSLVLGLMAARPPVDKGPVGKPDHRAAILQVAEAEVGTVEATGRNDGDVEKYIGSVGLNPKGRYPYCAAYVYWVGREASRKFGYDNPYPKSAWSPDFGRGGIKVKTDTAVRGGEAGTLYYSSKGRIGHVFICRDRQGAFIRTFEGNTSMDAVPGSSADREGQGVHSKRRHWRTVYKIRDFLISN